MDELSIVNYLPLLLSERSLQSQVSLFKFWLNGAVHDGLRHQEELFQLCRNFNSAQRDEVYKVGCELERSGIRAVITFSGSQYRLWTNLRGATSAEDGDDRHDPSYSRIPCFEPKPAIPNHLPSHLMLQPMQC